MFLRCKVRRKDGKQHRYWSVVENTRTARGRVVQRHVLYLGEINDTQEFGVAAVDRGFAPLLKLTMPARRLPHGYAAVCCQGPFSQHAASMSVSKSRFRANSGSLPSEYSAPSQSVGRLPPVRAAG